MDNLEKKYEIGGVLLTPEELYNRVKDFSIFESVPTKKILQICGEESFPMYYAIEIKVEILNYYSKFESETRTNGFRYHESYESEPALEICFNSLFPYHTVDITLARSKFLLSKICSATSVSILDSHFHPGPTFKKMHDEFCMLKLNELLKESNISFKKLRLCRGEFISLVKDAEERGDFKDDTAAGEDWNIYYELLSLL